MTVLVVAAACAGCTASSAPAQQRGGDRPGLGGSITVSAASSLGPAFESIVAEVKRQNPRAKVQLNLASSTALALQIEQGAPADVFASADPVAMGRLGVASHLAGRAEPFARNRMTIVTKPGNPRRIRSLADLRRAEVVAECVSTAPCGTYAAQALDRAGVELDEGSVTREPDAATTVGAVANGDADAGIVYLS
ncbi:MAG: molybdate ABC transporter substrate-binding protein, partial [Acidimicrobiia bacterium]|nr:molybdate ABC transporter substrate-binding protein [Acidimicrobiia bacterium]